MAPMSWQNSVCRPHPEAPLSYFGMIYSHPSLFNNRAQRRGRGRGTDTASPCFQDSFRGGARHEEELRMSMRNVMREGVKPLATGMLVGLMALSSFPTVAFAGESDPQMGEAIYDCAQGLTYYSVDSSHIEDSSRLFFQDLMTGKTKFLSDAYTVPGNPADLNKADGSGVPDVDSSTWESQASRWQELGQVIQGTYGSGTGDSKFKADFDYALGEHLATRRDTTGEVSVEDVHRSGGDDDYYVYGSGFTSASSVADAVDQMEDDIWAAYRNAGGGRKDPKDTKDDRLDDVAIEENTALDNYTSNDVWYMDIGAYKTSGKNKKGHYQALGLIFSDFKVSTVLPDDDDYYTHVKNNAASDGEVFLSDLKNETNRDITGTQTLTSTVQETATSTINRNTSLAQAFNMSRTATMGAGGSVVVAKMNSSFGFTMGLTTTGTIQAGWTDSEALTDSLTNTYTVNVPLEPYTNVLLKQYESTTTTTTTYNCPVALEFDVAVVEWALDPSDNNAKADTRVLAEFKDSAASDLYQRAIVERSLTDGDGINWNSLIGSNTTLEKRVQQLATSYATSTTGATMEVTDNSVTQEVYGKEALRPLDRVSVNHAALYTARLGNMRPGDRFVVNNIALSGYNDQNASYYGFNKLNGHWILVDDTGDEVTDSPIARLEKNPASGLTSLVAGDQSGTLTLRYVIDEDAYTSSLYPGHYTTNDELSRTATLEVHVNAAPEVFQGFIAVSGELTGIVGDAPQAIEGDNALTATVYDPTGKEVAQAVTWEAQELTGITVEDGAVSFSVPGTYHVRARVDDVYSDWCAVTAQPARALGKAEIPESMQLNTEALQMSDVPVATYDQYGDEFATDEPVEWFVVSGGATIEDGMLVPGDSGTIVVEATVGDVTSNRMTVSVTPEDTKAVAWGIDKGVTTMDFDNFDGDGSCTRAMAVTMMWRAAGCPEPASLDTPFTDVDENVWYGKAVAWAYENGVTDGTTPTTFEPGSTVSRAEIVTFLWKQNGRGIIIADGSSFQDVRSTDWFARAVKWAANRGVVIGASPTTFSPFENCTRQQIMLMIYRNAMR